MCGRNGTDEDYPAGATRSEPHIGERRFYLRDGTSTTTNVGGLRNREYLTSTKEKSG